MPSNQEQRKQQFRIEDLESYNRIVNIPIVNSGLNIAENVYERIKKTNGLLNWTLDQAEDTIKAVTHNPAIVLLATPLGTIDRVICVSLDIVESKIPSINLPPKMIYSNTKEYMEAVSTKIVKPVIKRADSVKKITSTVLTSKYTEYAADKLDDALDVADAYIDKYLPDQEDQKDSQDGSDVPDGARKKAIHTIQHADRISRKLQRRLTKRTLEHAKIIKEQGTEAIHVILYVGELIVTDPKLALQKTKELWAELSKDEPENQARPENVEELFVLVVREIARKWVHLVNFSGEKAIQLPFVITQVVEQAAVLGFRFTQAFIESLRVEEVVKLIVDTLKLEVEIVDVVRKEISSFVNEVLEQSRQPDPPAQSSSSNKTSGALTVPKIEVNSKAANSKGNSNSNHNVHRDHQGQHGHAHKRNGAHSPSPNKDT